jgi:hypothetical protein
LKVPLHTSEIMLSASESDCVLPLTVTLVGSTLCSRVNKNRRVCRPEWEREVFETSPTHTSPSSQLAGSPGALYTSILLLTAQVQPPPKFSPGRFESVPR